MRCLDQRIHVVGLQLEWDVLSTIFTTAMNNGQANKYRELAGSRSVRVMELEAEIKALKASVQRMRDL